MSKDDLLMHQDTDGDRTGQMFVYKDANGITKVCMVGYDAVQEEYDLMPEYLQEHFERPDDRYNEVLLGKELNVYVIPEDVVQQIEETQIEQAKKDS